MKKIAKINFHNYDHNGTSGHCRICGGYFNDESHDNDGVKAKINELIDAVNKINAKKD